MSIAVNIKKRKGSFRLEVAFSAQDETLSLLGDSGCGKSLTLRCIAGIEKPDEGSIVINGRTVFDSAKSIDLPPQQRKVGYLFQNYALFPNMTVVENIMAGMEREKGLRRPQRRALALDYVKALHLDGLEEHYPRQLSGGQQQRCALARILASKPDLLLLDEPFSALDATLRWEMEQVVRQTIGDFAGTTLLVTHDRDEVYRLSARVAVYRKGHIDILGEKWALFSAPVTATCARLTGCKNLSPARREGDRVVAEDWQLSFPAPAGDTPCDWVGIRAHRFRLCSPEAPGAFPYEVVQRIEDTFSFILQIRRRGTQAGLLRWEVDKSLHLEVPDTGYVTLPPEDILFLSA